MTDKKPRKEFSMGCREDTHTCGICGRSFQGTDLVCSHRDPNKKPDHYSWRMCEAPFREDGMEHIIVDRFGNLVAAFKNKEDCIKVMATIADYEHVGYALDKASVPNMEGPAPLSFYGRVNSLIKSCETMRKTIMEKDESLSVSDAQAKDLVDSLLRIDSLVQSGEEGNVILLRNCSEIVKDVKSLIEHLNKSRKTAQEQGKALLEVARKYEKEWKLADRYCEDLSDIGSLLGKAGTVENLVEPVRNLIKENNDLKRKNNALRSEQNKDLFDSLLDIDSLLCTGKKGQAVALRNRHDIVKDVEELIAENERLNNERSPRTAKEILHKIISEKRGWDTGSADEWALCVTRATEHRLEIDLSEGREGVGIQGPTLVQGVRGVCTTLLGYIPIWDSDENKLKKVSDLTYEEMVRYRKAWDVREEKRKKLEKLRKISELVETMELSGLI